MHITNVIQHILTTQRKKKIQQINEEANLLKSTRTLSAIPRSALTAGYNIPQT